MTWGVVRMVGSQQNFGCLAVYEDSAGIQLKIQLGIELAIFANCSEISSFLLILGGSTKISSLIAGPTQRTLNTLANGEPGNLTPSAELPPLVDNFFSQVMRPFLKGTTNHSVVIDITALTVAQKPLFLSDLQTFFNGNKHLWAGTDQICCKYNRLLPYQYGHQDGRLAQLHADMTNNFSQFDAIVDCGYVTGSSGLYAGSGYAVLVLSPPNSTHSSVKLSHSLNWSYQPLDYSSDTGTLSSDFDHVSIFVTWAAMPPFCRYCHSDKHALINCDLLKKATMCCLCNAGGHIAKSCPCKNESSVTSQKRRKILVVQETPQPSTPSSSIVVPPLPSSSSTNVPTTTGRVKCIQGSLERSVTRSQASLVVPNALNNPNPIKEHKLPLPLQPNTNISPTHTASTISDYLSLASSLPFFSCKLNIGTINCCGLAKTADISSCNQFIRYLLTRSLDLLALQETHATSTLQDTFHSQFQAKTSFWSVHCGLISFSSDIILSNSFTSPCGCIISSTVSHLSMFLPIDKTNSPSCPLSALNFHPYFLSSPCHTVILRDFNYTYSPASPRVRQAPHNWLKYINEFFTDGITPPGQISNSTFHRGLSQSCIDYLFVSSDMASSIHFDHSRTTYVQPAWSDHFLLSAQLRLSPATHASSLVNAVGKGLWRSHPWLANNCLFCTRLTQSLHSCVHNFAPGLSHATKWEALKATTAKVARTFKDLLHRKHAGITKKLVTDPSLLPVLSPQLLVVEHQLSQLQQYHVENLALRSGLWWRELRESSPGYLKQSIASRASRKLIPPLWNPATSSICTSQEEMLETTTQFYSDLYSPDDVDQAAIDNLLNVLPTHLHIFSSTAESLVAPIMYNDLLDAFSRSPQKSSPGMDSLPYELIWLVVILRLKSTIMLSLCLIFLPLGYTRCSTVLNSLILSRLWHVLRVVSTPKSFFKSVQSIISQFINFRIFPWISFATACLPRSQGGLGLLNPELQQGALQLRWLGPILSTSSLQIWSRWPFSRSIILPCLLSFLQHHLQHHSNGYGHDPKDLDHWLLFLFPRRCPLILLTGQSSLSLLLHALEQLPHTFVGVIATTATCLEIPISYIITPTPPATLPQSIADLPISVAYTYDLHHFHCLRPKHRQECIVYPTLSHNVQALVSDPDTTMSSFFTHAFTAPSSGTFISPSPTAIFDHTFINVHPFLLSLGLVPRSSDPSRLKLTMKMYC
ncbi:hypothetical protein PHYBLDRAFT_165386 [Phycomyces blakesleeanus NRRL 1555(-)]|uniref:CCHC-type zinc finger transcription factor n=1 Tax=Phycomyces blakesleeanus (strain ATCC 8743b / DSM 1359 / FGSC 10004 / NBRC 33097 / NRRL 1555) TaxID=763407 RepID=A0A167NYN4_PHYB8|nr:hypothetical protein PHYBLDRAFT_165386 [Phycomyces blakesleeanus NRRL 1555(-)]OAD76888.1 hypothetical protein PHYBLDRAFT_165386 [Phycomyces blakesleeanus NRRL 1555(-)]|eukprot:XP_018294928.1 hypothetical protein PHYBLDRAFT_165386 [Phycomyces blakesleeanus NRRL 1555(-)]